MLFLSVSVLIQLLWGVLPVIMHSHTLETLSVLWIVLVL